MKCSCFDQPKRLVKTDIGWRQSIGALFEQFHAIFTLLFAALTNTRMILLVISETLFENAADEPRILFECIVIYCVIRGRSHFDKEKTCAAIVIRI